MNEVSKMIRQNIGWRKYYWIGIKHLVLHYLEKVILLFYVHRHNYILWVDSIDAVADSGTSYDMECTKCGKSETVKVLKRPHYNHMVNADGSYTIWPDTPPIND